MTIASYPPLSTQARGLFYGWKMVGYALLINTASSGPVWGATGVWVKALELHFDWSRTQITGAFSLAQFQGSLIGPIIGYLIDRLGPRRMIVLGFPLMGLGFILFSASTNLAVFYLSFVVIMVGSSAGAWLPLMTALNRWFNRRRGSAMGIAGAGYFLGGVMTAPMLAWSVDPANIGWRGTAFWIGMVFVVAAWPLSRLIRDTPQQYGLLPDGDSVPDISGDDPAHLTAAGADAVAPAGGFTVRQALRTRAFWFITFGHALSSMLIATMTVHMVPMLTDQGLSLQMAANAWATLMAVGLAFQLIGGYIGDRVPIHLAIAFFSAVQAGGFAMAVLVDSSNMAFLFAVVYGIGVGGRNPLTVAIRGDYFGQKAFATITGASLAPLYVFMVVAPLFAANMFDSRGSYTLPFLILAVLGACGAALFIFAERPILPSASEQLRALERTA
ncbi:MAG: MFS transporter [SAR202 cluster bacterium Io17-Chloro-G7]|nr:MAG: MFS transporter [SAR202 cluster bacterium Io17-Chloro-G7]